jgi:hypothetical protein
MNSDNAMKILFVSYIFICALCVKEKNYPRALYWISAAFLTFSILWGMK